MLDDRKRLTLMVCLFLSLPFLFGCFLDMRRVVEISTDNQGHAPIRTLRVTMDPTYREKLFEQFQKLAAEHGFEIEISDYGSGGASYLVWMVKDNIKID